jgi:protein TonB
MSGTIAVNGNAVYGAFELKKLYPKYYTAGVTIAVLVHLLLIGVYILYNGLNPNFNKIIPGKPISIREYNPIFFSDPPIDVTSIKGSPSIPKNGIPIPAPGGQASKDETIPDQRTLSQLGYEPGESTGIRPIPDYTEIVIDDTPIKDPGLDEFIPVEKYPELVFNQKPEYPALAVKAGITGKVTLRVLVDKEGKPKRAVVILSDSELLNQNAINAAMKSVFTPALQNTHPIEVWVSLSYRFTLENR